MSLSIFLYTKGSWSSADRTQKVAVNEAFPRPKLNHFDLPLVTATPSLGHPADHPGDHFPVSAATAMCPRLYGSVCLLDVGRT